MIRLWTSILLGSFIASLASQPATAGIIRDRSDCQIVGAILNSDNPKLQGVLCEDDKLDIQTKVLISCRYKSTTQWLKAGIHEINRLCPPHRVSQPECLNSQGCFRNGTKLYLIGQTFASQEVRPLLEWAPINNAKGYALLIQSSDGKEVYRDKVINSEYQFTKPLRPGELYQIDISVMGELISDKFAFHILSEEHIDELNSMLEIINSGSWTEIEKALYRDGAYTWFGLTLEAIDNLEQSPELERSRELQARLGDLFLDAGYFEKAQEIFEMLEQTTSEGDNLQSQLPTSTNPPQ